jgi:hypothetical protein
VIQINGLGSSEEHSRLVQHIKYDEKNEQATFKAIIHKLSTLR